MEPLKKLKVAVKKIKGSFEIFGATGKPGPEVIKLFSISTQLSMKFIMLINIKMPTTVGISVFISRINIILS